MRNRFILLIALISIGFVSSASAAILTCDLDGDRKSDSVERDGRELTVTLSESGQEVIITLNNRYTRFGCVKKDGEYYIVARVNSRSLPVFFPILGNGSSKDKGKGSLSSVCKSTRALLSCEIWKSRQSNHIPSSDPRKNSTAMILKAGCGTSYPSVINGYDKKGNLIHKLGQYFPTGTAYRSRHYGGHRGGDGKSVSSLVAALRKSSGSTELYLRDNRGSCAKVPNVASCYNSSGC